MTTIKPLIENNCGNESIQTRGILTKEKNGAMQRYENVHVNERRSEKWEMKEKRKQKSERI